MSTFSKKHYEVIARVVKASDMDGIDRSLLIDKFCVEFTADNPRFNRDTFTKACQPRVDPLKLVEDDEPCVLCSGDGWCENYHGDGSVNKRWKCDCTKQEPFVVFSIEKWDV